MQEQTRSGFPRLAHFEVSPKNPDRPPGHQRLRVSKLLKCCTYTPMYLMDMFSLGLWTLWLLWCVYCCKKSRTPSSTWYCAQQN